MTITPATPVTHTHRIETTSSPYIAHCHCGMWFTGRVDPPTRDAEGNPVFGSVIWQSSATKPTVSV